MNGIVSPIQNRVKADITDVNDDLEHGHAYKLSYLEQGKQKF